MPEPRPYQDPVAKLLSLDVITQADEEWIDYATNFGLSTADLPELTRLSWDEEPPNCDSGEWVTHSLRAIVQLDPAAGIDLYLKQLEQFPQDDFLHEEMNGIGRQVGEIGIEPLVKCLKDGTQDAWVRSTAAQGLEAIGRSLPECRATCVQALTEQLQSYREQDDEILNSMLVDNLIDLKAVEAAPLIEEVFANRAIDEWLTGSWAAVQVELGLKQKSDFSPAELKPTPPEHILKIQQALNLAPPNKGFGSSVKSSKKPKQAKKKKR
jgi:Protein of unknown function (DUF1186)